MKIQPAYSAMEMKTTFENGEAVSVFLGQGTKSKMNFRCFNCSLLLLFIYKDVDLIGMDGSHPKGAERSLDLICSRCNLTYKLFW